MHTFLEHCIGISGGRLYSMYIAYLVDRDETELLALEGSELVLLPDGDGGGGKPTCVKQMGQ